jgi:cell division protein FtsQ
VSAIVVASVWGLTNSVVFHARDLSVTGTMHLSRSDVLRIAAVDEGTNVFWLHTGDVARRLERSRWVAHAEVSKSLPSTIRIVIKERTPVAELQKDAGFVVVAADGTELARTTIDPGLPRLVIDESLPSNEAEIGRTAWVSGGMSPWLRRHVRAVSRTSTGNVIVHLDSGVPAYYGEPTSILAKDRALAAVLRWALREKKDLRFIDVAAPGAPTARLDIDLPPVTVPLTGPGGAPAASPGPGASPSASASPSPSPSPASSPSPSRSAPAAHHVKKTKHSRHG